MRAVYEVAIRWGDTLVDVQHVGARGSCTLGTQPLVRAGVVVGATRGKAGLVAYEIARVDLPDRFLPYARTDDRRIARYFALALALHLVLWGVAITRHPEQGTPHVRRSQPRPVHVAKGFVPVPDTLADDRSVDSKEPGQGTPMALDAGKAGREAEAEHGHVEIARVAESLGVARDVAKRHAREAGMLGTEAMSASAFTSLASTTELTNGFDPSTVQASLYGGTGEANGAFGFGQHRSDAGAGCLNGNCGTIGIGRYGTMSNGTSPGRSWGGHTIGAPGLRTWQGATIDICGRPSADHCMVRGPLDFQVVRRFVRHHRAQLVACYERELLAKPGLRGDISVDFLIEGTGTVLAANATGFDDDVSSCVAHVLRETAFPISESGNTQVQLVIGFRF